MSRVSESDHATSHAARRGPPSADLDAEHDPEVARRTSLAGLHREVGLQRGTSSGSGPAAEREDPHGRAERKSVAAVESALALATARIHERSRDIPGMVAVPFSGAGAEPILIALRMFFEETQRDLERLNVQIKTLDPESRAALKDDVLRLVGAAELFSNQWVQAVRFDRNHGETQKLSDKKWSALLAEAQTMRQSVGLPEQEISIRSPSKVDSSTLRAQAIDANLEAMSSCVESMARSQVVSPDLDNLHAHLKELLSMLGQGAVRSAQVARIRVVLARVKGVNGKVATQWGLEDVAGEMRTKIRQVEEHLRGGER